jgi:Second Messenger Oligonucleotide or Dinucleotide Synthetase domain
MLTIDEAFRKFKSRLELNDREQKNASSRHQEIREHMRSRFDIKDDFLSGSYRRYTKTKPLKDVDIFCVLGKEEVHYRGEHPSKVLVAFEETLVEKYGAKAVSRQRRSATVDFGVFVDADDKTDYRVVSMDVIPAFEDGDNYEIPDGTSGKWIKTNPKIHEQKATSAHQAYDSEWKGLVRMVKYWNNHHGKLIKPSFLLEVMALECLAPPFGGRFDYEFQSMFATLADRIRDTWDDPAGLGPSVSDMMDAGQKTAAQTGLRQAARACTLAIDLARQGKNGDALKAWRALFGPRFPLS